MILVLRVISKGLTSEINFWPWPKFLNCTIKTWKIKSSRLSWVYCTTRKNTFQWAKRLPDEQKRITVVNIICSILFTNWIVPRYVSTYVLYYNFFFTKNVFKRHRWAPLKQIITIYNSFIAKKKFSSNIRLISILLRLFNCRKMPWNILLTWNIHLKGTFHSVLSDNFLGFLVKDIIWFPLWIWY